MMNRDRLTYKTQGDATRGSHYCTGPGIKKDDVVQRLGEYEDTGLSPDEVKAAEEVARKTAEYGKASPVDFLDLLDENAKLKDLLKKAAEAVPNLTDMWRYADEVLALIGGGDK